MFLDNYRINNIFCKKLIPEALQAVINYLFSQTETTEIVAFCRVDNPRSQKVLEKCGFIKQGSKQEEVKGVMAIFDRFVKLQQ
ncbi:MAG: GNAT family N-acetyltransferase [Candidatus Babeliales bacterium]